MKALVTCVQAGQHLPLHQHGDLGVVVVGHQHQVVVEVSGGGGLVDVDLQGEETWPLSRPVSTALAEM